MKISLPPRAASLGAFVSVALFGLPSVSWATVSSTWAPLQEPDLEVLALTNAPIAGTDLQLFEVAGVSPGVDGGWVTTAVVGVDTAVLETAIYGDMSIDGSTGPGILRRPQTINGYVQARIGQPELRGGQIAYLASLNADPSAGFDSAWIDDQLIEQAGNPVSTTGATWELFRDIRFGADGHPFLRGRTSLGSVLTRRPIDPPLLFIGDNLPGALGPLRRVEQFDVSPNGENWAARVVLDDDILFRSALVVNGALWAEGGALAIERFPISPDFGLDGATWEPFSRFEVDDTGGLTFQTEVQLESNEFQTVTVRNGRFIDVADEDRRFRDALGSPLTLFTEQFEVRVNDQVIVDASAQIDADGDGAVDPGYRLGADATGGPNWAAGFTSFGIVGRCLLEVPDQATDVVALVRTRVSVQGEDVCTGVPNSTGFPSTLSSIGQASIAPNDLTLLCAGLPEDSMGFAIASRQSGFVASPQGSQGNLCLSGDIGRLISEIFVAGPEGLATIPVDLLRIPRPMGTAAVMAGETWFFQSWHRDRVGDNVTSNFTSAISVTFLE